MPTTLLALLEHETTARDRCSAALQRAQVASENGRAQAEQLLHYRRDYQTRWSPQARGASSVELLHSFRAFMQRLDDAVAQQRHQVHALEAQQAAVQRQCHAHERRLASLRVLIERRRAMAAVQARRREQKDHDEFAQRQATARPQPAPDTLSLHADALPTTY